MTIWNKHDRFQFKLPQTTVEGWHRAFLTSVGACHPSIFNLIEKLQLEQSSTELILAKILSGVTFPLFSNINYKKLNDKIENMMIKITVPRLILERCCIQFIA
jgi:hypothetical protein